MGNTLRKVSLDTFRGTKSYAAYCNSGLRGFTDLINGLIDQDDIGDLREIQAILFFSSERFGVPMQYLADQTGYTRQSFSHYRSGKAIPSQVMCRRILNLLLQPLAEQLPPLPEGL